MSSRKLLFSPPDISNEEIEEVVETLKSGWITTGPKTKKLEEEIAKFCKTNKAVCLNSATACLELILRILGIGPGDEVITSAYTYTASCSVICHVGATPVIVDTRKDSLEMDYDVLESVITEKTKAIIPVDLAGIICDYDKIFEVVKRKKNLFCPKTDIQKKIGRIAVVADSAHAFGASRKGIMAGNIADFTAFSFHAVKNFTTAEGGAATWKPISGMSDDEIYRQFMIFSLHGQTKDALSKTKLGSWEYDILTPGFKCNMTDILAAIGLAQMKRYPGLLQRRKEIILRYNKNFEGQPFDYLDHYGEDHKSSGHLYFVKLRNNNVDFRNYIIDKLSEKGIPANVHYKPLPLLTAYKNLGFDISNYPNAYEFYINEITLPLHTQLLDDDVDYISKNFIKVFESASGELF